MPLRHNEVNSMIRQEPFAYIAEPDADGNIEYEAWSYPGVDPTTANWICAKNTYDTDMILIRTRWAKDDADGVGYYTNKANNLSGLTYV